MRAILSGDGPGGGAGTAGEWAMIVKEGRRAKVQPFDTQGVERADDGVLRYTGLPGSLVEMLRSTVERHAGEEAIVELDGPRVSYRQLWDRSARVAGGLVAAGV